MRTAANFQPLWQRSPWTAPFPVALTALAAGAVLVPAVNAAFLIVSKFADRQPPKRLGQCRAAP